MFYYRYDGDVIATCALGAAIKAGYKIDDKETEAMTLTVCPVCHERFTWYGTIAHINDDHGWTREKIADWVEGTELAREGKAQPITRDELYARAERELVPA
jgi:hypothetical protein